LKNDVCAGGFDGVEGISIDSIGTVGPLGLSVGECIMILWVDSVLYALLLFYFDRVVPQGLWTPEAPWFIFQPSFWRRTCGASGDVDSSLLGPGLAAQDVEPAEDDCAREVMVRDDDAVEIVQLESVSKVFPKKYCSQWASRSSPDDVKAVDGVTLTLHSGQIFGLLGHNGAGKTTLMRIMSGLHTPTSGKCYVNGLDVTTSINEVRQSLGVCPQHDLLFENLTVMEHIELYGELKGVPRADVQREGATWLAKMELAEKAQAMASTLSGGQKRRLSVAMSLIGTPQVVYLDEPTTGLDPAARRNLWKIVKESRQGRLILLSTHHMDEADVLADQKAIMAHGRLQCVGSSMFLKSHFGLGYQLELTKSQPDAAAQTSIRALVQQHVPSATLVMDSDSECHFRLPIDDVKTFGALLTDVERNLQDLRLSGYGITASTLEQVFMRFADGGDLAEGAGTEATTDVGEVATTTASPTAMDAAVGAAAAAQADVNVSIDVNLANEAFASDADAKDFSWSRVKAMAVARWIFSWRNKESNGIAFFMPIVLIIVMVSLPDVNSVSREGIDPYVFSSTQLTGSAATVLPIALGETAGATFEEVQAWLQQETQLQVQCWDTTSADCVTGSEGIAGAFLASEQNRQAWRGVLVFNTVNLAVTAGISWEVVLVYSALETHALPIYTALLDSAILSNAAAQPGGGGVPMSITTSTLEMTVGAQPVPFQLSPLAIIACFALTMPAVALCALLVRDVELQTRFQVLRRQTRSFFCDASLY
jgi:ABC-type multidrug transport system ATPase subunit